MQIGDLAADIADLSATARYRVEIMPDVKDVPFWAFVSITNNSTQHVTVVTPRGNASRPPTANP